MTKTLEILNDLKIEYKHVIHEPIINYEIAKKIDQENNLTGMESKNLFLVSKSNKYYLLVTKEGTRFDRNFFKELLEEKISITSPDELNAKTGYVVGSAPSFPYPDDVTYIIDISIFDYDKYICSAGIPTESYEMITKDIIKVYETQNNKVKFLDFDKGSFVDKPN